MQDHSGRHVEAGATPDGGGKRAMGLVLSVDDDRLNQKVAKLIVESAGFDFVGVNSGAQCLQALETLEPQIILLDVMMPGLDGFETCRRIRRQFSGGGPRIIFVTARNMAEDVQRALETQADDYLVKPIEMQSLHSRLMHWIAQSPRMGGA